MTAIYSENYSSEDAKNDSAGLRLYYDGPNYQFNELASSLGG